MSPESKIRANIGEKYRNQYLMWSSSNAVVDSSLNNNDYLGVDGVSVEPEIKTMFREDYNTNQARKNSSGQTDDLTYVLVLFVVMGGLIYYFNV